MILVAGNPVGEIHDQIPIGRLMEHVSTSAEQDGQSAYQGLINICGKLAKRKWDRFWVVSIKKKKIVITILPQNTPGTEEIHRYDMMSPSSTGLKPAGKL